MQVAEKNARKLLKMIDDAPLWLKISASTVVILKLYVDYKWTQLDSWGIPIIKPKGRVNDRDRVSKKFSDNI